MGTDLWNYWLMVMYETVRICLVLLLTQGVKQRLIICLFLCVRESESEQEDVYMTPSQRLRANCVVCVCVSERSCVGKGERLLIKIRVNPA